MIRRRLYPPLEPYDHGFLEVGAGHAVYYEQCGNPDGKAAVFVHGGPGAGGDVGARRFFDPAGYRIIVFDQRGAGRSRPEASLTDNTTWHLVADMERLRNALGISSWLVFGGSWGSTLSLAYAQRHPAAVSELVLRGIFLLRQKELQWFYQSGASEIYPDQWAQFLAPIPPDERDDLLSAYHRRLISDDEQTRLTAARAWSIWEGSTSFLSPDPKRTKQFGTPEFALALARIETHFFVNRGFFATEEALLEGVGRIRHIPAVIVQGRYDVVCPMATAWELASRWPEADLRVVGDAGHSAYEPGITHELVSATDAFLEGG
ncbi:MAG: prolyl aminopeptidase [Rhodospirillaceae bacterium]|nr:prolyl aminopeptidase [Rhodospirillaceae bacterium]